MPEIDHDFICYQLTILPQAKLVAQRKHKVEEERRLTMDQEIEKILHVNFIREVTYTTWLSNIVILKKANGE